jgi:hypothetical protein
MGNIPAKPDRVSLGKSLPFSCNGDFYLTGKDRNIFYSPFTSCPFFLSIAQSHYFWHNLREGRNPEGWEERNK